MIDSAKMTPEHYKEAYKEIVSSVWTDKVRWDVKSKWDFI
jgi:DNA-binding ferritin-like protein (Dps family)